MGKFNKENEPLVSIICTAYNHGKFIKNALEGFLMQKTTFTFEILIHDDASTDNTANIIREYEKKYPNIIKAIYQKENQYSKGKIPTIFLYEKAKGKYLAFCEGDDYWTDENKLERQVNFLEKDYSYYGIVHNYLPIDENSKEIFSKNFFREHDIETVEELKKWGMLCSQTATIVCRNFWKEFDKKQKENFIKIKTYGDLKINLTMLMKGKVHFFQKIMSCYRITYNTDSWTSKTKDRNLTLVKYNMDRELEKMALSIFNQKIEINSELKLKEALFIFFKNKKMEDLKIFIKVFILEEKKIKSIFYLLKIIGIKCLKIVGIKLKQNKLNFEYMIPKEDCL